MPTIVTIPKDAIYFEANDLDDFMNCSDRWAVNGWLLSKDVKKNIYYAIALKDAKVLLLTYDNNPNIKEDQPVDQPVEQPMEETNETKTLTDTTEPIN